ncbi:MAG: hypothetical protein BWY87_00965 [Deltaproteobacteria bacterium ADurb.Bin510]|nr:MAG: hypothetical protein BWY87_00965 [Deltaproteobacteria bacterium ADurb.Bin510]
MNSDQGESRIRLALEAIAELSAGLSANQATQAEMDQTLASLWQAIEATSQHVATVRAIGFKMQLIALNSRIKAAHLGEEGRVLESISGAIYAISLAARDQTERLAGSIASLELEPAASSEIPRTELDLETTSRRLLTIEAELEPALETIRAKSAGFGEGFERIRDLLQLAAAMPPAITAERDALKALLDGLEAPVGSADLSELSERYTMQSERAVHAQQDAQPSAAAFDDELGLNVELF